MDTRSLGDDLPIYTQDVPVVITYHSLQESLSGNPTVHLSRKELSVDTA